MLTVCEPMDQIITNTLSSLQTNNSLSAYDAIKTLENLTLNHSNSVFPFLVGQFKLLKKWFLLDPTTMVGLLHHTMQDQEIKRWVKDCLKTPKKYDYIALSCLISVLVQYGKEDEEAINLLIAFLRESDPFFQPLYFKMDCLNGLQSLLKEAARPILEETFRCDVRLRLHFSKYTSMIFPQAKSSF